MLHHLVSLPTHVERDANHFSLSSHFESRSRPQWLALAHVHRASCWLHSLIYAQLFLDCKSKLAGVINFVTGNLRPIRSDVDESLSHWYKMNSRVYVSNNHGVWMDAAQEKKVRKKRFGTVIRSPETGLNTMMHRHFLEVQDYIRERAAPGHGETGETTEDDAMVGASGGVEAGVDV